MNIPNSPEHLASSYNVFNRKSGFLIIVLQYRSCANKVGNIVLLVFFSWLLTGYEWSRHISFALPPIYIGSLVIATSVPKTSYESNGSIEKQAICERPDSFCYKISTRVKHALRPMVCTKPIISDPVYLLELCQKLIAVLSIRWKVVHNLLNWMLTAGMI